MGSLQDALPCRVDEEVEARFLEILRRKMAGAVSLHVATVRAVEESHGPEAVEALRRSQLRRAVERAGESGRASPTDLRGFCRALEEGCRGSHEWVKLEDGERRQAYRFTRCMWADIYRSLDAADIGFWICEGDGPVAAAINPSIHFERTKTLMQGDDCCDHVYYVDEG